MTQLVKPIRCYLETVTPVHIGTGSEFPSTDYLIYQQPKRDKRARFATSSEGSEIEPVGALASQLAAALRETMPRPEDVSSVGKPVLEGAEGTSRSEENLPERAFVAYNLRRYLQDAHPEKRRQIVQDIYTENQSFRLDEALSVAAQETTSCWHYYAGMSPFAIQELHRSRAKAIYEHIKLPATDPNEFDQIYISGSTLKGALRTALGYFLASNNLYLLARSVASSSGRPRQSTFDRLAFQSGSHRLDAPRSDAQVDILRCIVISDSDAKPATDDTLEVDVVQTGTFPNRGDFYFKTWASFYEVIKPSQTFRVDMNVKSALLGHGETPAQLGWLPPIEPLKFADLPTIVNRFALATIENEIDYLESVPRARNLANAVYTMYQELKRQVENALEQDKNTCYLCLGRGSGRHTKTVELAIYDPQQPALRFALYGGKREDGRLGDGTRGKGNLGRADVRHVEKNNVRRPVAPVSRLFTISSRDTAKNALGWVKLVFGEGFEEAKSEVIPIPSVKRDT